MRPGVGAGELRASLAQLDGERQVAGLTGPVHGRRATRSASRPYAAARARTSRAPPGSSTPRTASSRWTSRAGAPQASWRRWSARARSRSIARSACTASAPRRERALALLTRDDRAILDAYAARRQQRPRRAGRRRRSNTWCCARIRGRGVPEDSLLVVLSMFITLQDTDGSYESTLGDDERGAAEGDVRLPRAARDRMGHADRRRRVRHGADPRARRVRPARPAAREAAWPPSNGQLRAPNAFVASESRLGSVGSGAGELGVGVDGCGEAAIGSNNFAVAGRPDRRRRRARRQRHAPRHPRAEHVVPRVARMARSVERRASRGGSSA